MPNRPIRIPSAVISGVIAAMIDPVAAKALPLAPIHPDLPPTPADPGTERPQILTDDARRLLTRYLLGHNPFEDLASGPGFPIRLEARNREIRALAERGLLTAHKTPGLRREVTPAGLLALREALNANTPTGRAALRHALNPGGPKS